MEYFIQIFLIIPLLGYLLSIIYPKTNERLISWSAVITTGAQLHSLLVFVAVWLFWGHHETLNLKEITLYQAGDYEFLLDFYFDKVTATYLFVGALLTFLISIYSRAYMHREEGYKRFFSTVQFFFLGYNITVLSGNFETLFLGWEMLGISSFLLIAFYRDRYLPVKNAVKIFSIYRIGDVGILLAMWMSHHLWHENITFMKLNNAHLVHEHLQMHSSVGVFISLMILLSAAAKSAQFPFSSWLPRAMEGPTPSSAVFYGSLSVHMGVFLLIRTYPFWEYQISVRILIGLMGLVTAVISSGIARVQSSVKSQIAYASISQMGIIFIEIALGLEWVALFHFAGNAFLRTYQLLVSPSVVVYRIREQFYTFEPDTTFEEKLPHKLRYMFYVLCIKEFGLDSLMYRYLWNPIKWAGRKLDFMTLKHIMFIFVPIYLLAVGTLIFEDYIPASIHAYLPAIYSLIGLLMVLKSFAERAKVRTAWSLIILNHLWVALAISFNEHYAWWHTALYLSGILPAGIVGFWCINWLRVKEHNRIDLDRFHGHSYEYPRMALLFLITCLGITGFPITPTFLGEDLIFSHIRENQLGLASIVSLAFIIDGLAAMRIYARLFLGPHIKTYHEVAYRSS